VRLDHLQVVEAHGQVRAGLEGGVGAVAGPLGQEDGGVGDHGVDLAEQMPDQVHAVRRQLAGGGHRRRVAVVEPDRALDPGLAGLVGDGGQPRRQRQVREGVQHPGTSSARRRGRSP